VGDAKELVACLNEVTPRLPEGRSESLGLSLLSLVLPKACDARNDTPRDRVCEMLGPLFKAKLLLPAEVETLFRDSLEFLEDEVVDVPHIAHYYARFLGASIAAELLPLAFLADALAPLVDATLVKPDAAVAGHAGAAFLLVEVLRALKREVGEERCASLYQAASLDVLALLPTERRTDAAASELLGAAELSFVDPGLAEAVKKAAAEASLEAVRAQLEALDAHLSSGVLAPSADGAADGADEAGADGGLDAVVKWLDERVSADVQSDDKVARVVMRCVLNAASADDAPSAQKICKQIERCGKVLKKVTAAPSSAAATASHAASLRIMKQAGCLYEVQAFCHAKNWPNALMKKLFYNLYETDVVFEDAYGVWREDVTDQTPGKDKALFQVNEFLQWLDEAAEDDGEEDN
jgi:hypothetical protein